MSDPTPSEEQVRRLLADARHDEPMPDDVAVRLDRVLADLQAESRRTPAPVDAPPIDLGARRRRRLARNVLVAAAAVVVLGVGISRLDLSGQDDASSGAADSSDSGVASAPESSAGGDAGGETFLVTGPPLVLSSEDFDAQVGRLRAAHRQSSLSELPEGYRSDADLNGEDLNKDLASGAKARAWCNDPGWGAGKRVHVRYDGRRGVLVLRPPSGGPRAADLYLCGETVPTRSTTVPAG